MAQLVLEYVFEGHNRGYNFTSPTKGFSEDILKAIWRNAMPRGQGWGAYEGARSLKCFLLEGGGVALSDVTVTDQRDESGRSGIRRAVIDVISASDCIANLERRFRNYPQATQAQAEARLGFGLRTRLMDKSMPRPNKNPQIVLSHGYITPAHWEVIEAMIVKLAIAPVIPMRRWGKIIPFTTLALDYREESRLVVLPEDRAQRIIEFPVVRV
jgi:hypothetical protein